MLCHQYKCIFVHVPKTGGQSIEQFFLNLLDLSWERRAPLLLRHNDNPQLGPPRLAHLTALEYLRYKYISDEIFNTYFKFAFVRNPWSRLVSHYKYNKFYSLYSFNHFVKKKFLKNFYGKDHWFLKPQYDFVYSSDGKLLVDYIGKFEALQKDFSRVATELGLHEAILPHVNISRANNLDRIFSKIFFLKANFFDNKQDYVDYYDDESQKIVSKIYIKDIETFEYKFK